MALSWNEIKDRAVVFSKEWEDTYNEEAEAKPFLEAFFNIFGITRKRVGTFEHRVKKLSETDGYIDLLWKGTILIEMKTKGKNLDKAFTQAKEYIHGIKEHELPKYILVSDFENFRLFDTEEQKTIEFKLKDLVSHVQHFGFIAGYQKRIYKEQDPVNIKAAELMGKLHDRLKEIGYDGHPLEVYLVRLLFCLFAEDTTIFEPQQFQNYIEERTNEDGSDLASKIQELFQTLNTPNDKRFKNLDEQLNSFPYINGKLFEEVLPSASFDALMRKSLLECCYIDWSKISPAIFGSMFQSVMNPKERRNLGAHYTSEKNILKLIKPLFLDQLWQEFESLRNTKGRQLSEFHKRISQLKFLDPACGCGNFLVITYRELRLLEIEILRTLNKSGQGFLDVREIIRLDVDMMFGIEFEEFPARIAEVAMWLMDHQMNMIISNEFGQYFIRLPLKKAAKIHNANALTINWETVIAKSDLSFILGNPPFIGKQVQNAEQKQDMEQVFSGVTGVGILDYVTAWYFKASKFIQGTTISVAFVSTNSIVQGEQVGALWGLLQSRYGIKIHFAHRTFNWSNEARGNAAVHVVIIGFANYDINSKSIFEYTDIKAEPHEIIVKNINAYLIDAKDIFVLSRMKPICNVPEIIKGSETTDNGHFMLSSDEVAYLKIKYINSDEFIRPFLGGGDFINGNIRYCLWLKDIAPRTIRDIPFLTDRVDKVRKFRSESPKVRTRHWAKFPTLFSEDRQPTERYLMLPKVSSEKRAYIPFAFVEPEFIVNNTASYIPNASLYIFGVLESKMHMTWVSHICGRMKSDYVYSNKIVYNNFPWPEQIKDKHKLAIEVAAQNVISIRMTFLDSTLAELYNLATMPPSLTKAHIDLDKAVDMAYRTQPFPSDTKRMEYLFELYESYTKDLFTKVKTKIKS
ncbi:DNA methyltransferase [Pedobacter sp. Leaf250]|uniref:class I SAM-dependent DNA methyltransferase n=1 Tax=Pedobacter sp. Leaf250 TaxID=2876559 RepID=UPI001E5F72D2|nr:DNA methyltransferase [Pedobacter sp. Leaf250]